MMVDIRVCPCCNRKVDRNDMNYTSDCQGITFRLVCIACYEKLMKKVMMENTTRKWMNI